MSPFFSSTFRALTVCDIHFCIWKLSKFIFVGPPWIHSGLQTTWVLEVHAVRLEFGPVRLTAWLILTTFEQIHRSLSCDLKDERKSGELKATISNLANVYWSSYKPTQNTLRKHGILKKLRTRKDIVIVRPDKGSGVVILDRDIYDRKILEIINDSAKFKKLKDNPTLTREGQLQRFLRKIKTKIFLMKICIRKFILVVLSRLIFTVFLRHIRCYLILMSFLFDQLSLP